MIKAILQIACGALIIFLSHKAVSYGYDLYQKGKASESWVATEARVEIFEASQASTRTGGLHRGGTGTVQNPHIDILYHYSYQGADYSGDKTGFGPYSKGQLKPPNRKGIATVYVNPENPTESVYVQGVSKPNLGFIALGIAMGLFGALLALWGLRNLTRNERG